MLATQQASRQAAPMAKSDTKPKTKLRAWGAGLAGIGLIVGIAGYGLLQQSAYVHESKHKATDYAEHAARQVEQACIRVPAPEKVRCLNEAKAEYNLKTSDNRREYDDLAAQRKSALWTFIMGMAALIGMALSAVGVILIKQTFDETRRTNLDQNRPWIFVKDVKLVPEHMKKLDAIVVFHNFGNWPATDFAKTVLAQQVPYPFAAIPMNEPDQSSATLLPPTDTEAIVVEDLPRSKPGHLIRIDLDWSYTLPGGAKERASQTFVIDINRGQAGVRKMTAYDSANHPSHAKGRDGSEGG